MCLGNSKWTKTSKPQKTEGTISIGNETGKLGRRFILS